MKLLEEGSHVSARKEDCMISEVIQLGDTMSLCCGETVGSDTRLICCPI